MGNVEQKHTQNPQEEENEVVSTFTCEICIEPVELPNKKFKNNSGCAHPYCTDCMIKYIEFKLEDNVSEIKCPALNCYQVLEPLSCRPKIPRQVFDKWCDVLCDSAVLGFDRVYCPNRDCSALVVNECGGSVRRSVCPNCKKLFCFQCKLPWHAGYRCEESAEMRDRNDVTFGVLLERKKWMRCPRCRHCVELVAGCSIVKCRCGTNFCYNCGRSVNNHWCNCRRSSACCMALFHLCLVFLIMWPFIILFVSLKNKH